MDNITADSDNYTYCNFALFRHNYRSVHGYLSLIVCILGSIANVFNICVLRRKEMRSPTNVILIGIAITDLLQILEYFPFIYHRHLSSEIHYARHYTHSAAVLYRYHSMISLSLHFISSCLTVVLSVWRYNFVSRLHVQNICCSQRNTAIVILCIYIVCPLVCYPSLAFSDVKSENQTVDEHGWMVLKHELSDHQNHLNLSKMPIYVVIMDKSKSYLLFWIYGICIKFLPCLLLSIFFYLILSILMRRNKRRQRRKLLINGNQLMELNSKNKQENIQIYKENQNDQTTKMLLIILLLFLIIQFPLSVWVLMGVFYGHTFIEECYNNIGDLFDFLSLLTSSINFVLYCAMSRKFRETFHEIFKLKLLTDYFPCNNQRIQEENGDTKTSLV